LELKGPAFVTISAVIKTCTHSKKGIKSVTFIKTTRLCIADVLSNEKFPNGLKSKIFRIASAFYKEGSVFLVYLELLQLNKLYSLE
jgi:hypothetical protein